MVANWTLLIISCYFACFAHRFSSDVAFFSRISVGFCQGEFSRTSVRSLPGVRARVLCLVDVAGSRAAWPERLRRRTRLAQDMFRCDAGGIPAFCSLCSAFFACRICERSCPHSIASPAALRYHDKNCFKRALKCIQRSNKQEKAPSIIKKGRIHGFSHLC